MPTVFISYNWHDKQFVRRLAKRLTREGVRVWLDETDLHIGDSIPDRIAHAIRDVDFVIAVISRHSVSSPWVQKELSLAMSKEVTSRSACLLPVRVDGTLLPATLCDKLYADFRNTSRFEKQTRRLLDTMGVRAEKPNRRRGLSVEWTDEGPRITGYRATISPTEGNVLFVRWLKWFDKLLPREKKRLGEENPTVWDATRIRATLKACEETYARTIYEKDLATLSSELGRKANLFYIFVERLNFEASARKQG